MITLEKISKSFDKKKVLNSIELAFIENECFTILGKNGAGKTTLLKIIAGLVKPDEGQVIIDGIKIGNEYPDVLKKNMGVSLGDETLIEELTGLEYLRFISLAYKSKKSKKEIEQIFNSFFDKPDDIKQKIGNYSDGMKQKMGFCASIIHNPRILILDEPFSGIDPFSAAKYIDFINAFKKNRIIIISSHDISYVARIADRIGVLQEKRIVFEDSISNFTNNGQKDFETALFEIIPPDTLENNKLIQLLENR